MPLNKFTEYFSTRNVIDQLSTLCLYMCILICKFLKRGLKILMHRIILTYGYYIETITFYKFKYEFCPLLIIIRITVRRRNWNFCVLQHGSRRKNQCIVSLIRESDMNEDKDDV